MAGASSRIRIWAPDTPKELPRIVLDTGFARVRAMAILADDILVAASASQTLGVWHLPSATPVDLLQLDVSVTALAATPAGLAVATDAGALEIVLHSLDHVATGHAGATIPFPADGAAPDRGQPGPGGAPEEQPDSTDRAVVPGLRSPRRDGELHTLLDELVAAASDRAGWAPLAHVGHLLRLRRPHFDPRDYGCVKLSTLVEATGRFDVEHRYPDSTRPAILHVRRRAVHGDAGHRA